MLDLSDMATDPDSAQLTWSTKVANSKGAPYDHKLVIEIDEDNIAKITPASGSIDDGYILFTVSDGELSDSLERPYALLPPVIPVKINKPEQGVIYTTLSIAIDVSADVDETIEYWVNNEDFIHTPGKVYTGPATLTESDGIKEGENTIIFKTISSPMVNVVSFVVNPTWSPPATEEEVVFPDANLEALIREAIHKPTGSILTSDLEALIYLEASEKDLTDLTGLEHCINLVRLQLTKNQISDISSLASLINLNELWLRENQISDISPLASLTKLTMLHLKENQISDISPLASLTKLTSLSLSYNQISDVSPLASLTKIGELSLDNNQISDISPLSSLSDLAGLYLDNNEISDISVLTSLPELGTLWLIGNPLDEASANVYIPQLKQKGVIIFR